MQIDNTNKIIEDFKIIFIRCGKTQANWLQSWKLRGLLPIPGKRSYKCRKGHLEGAVALGGGQCHRSLVRNDPSFALLVPSALLLVSHWPKASGSQWTWGLQVESIHVSFPMHQAGVGWWRASPSGQTENSHCNEHFCWLSLQNPQFLEQCFTTVSTQSIFVKRIPLNLNSTGSSPAIYMLINQLARILRCKLCADGCINTCDSKHMRSRMRGREKKPKTCPCLQKGGFYQLLGFERH